MPPPFILAHDLGTTGNKATLFDSSGALIGSTYLGGTANDGLNTAAGLKFNYADEVRGEVLLDAQGRVWVVSCTQTPNMPTTIGAAQTAFGGGSHDGYVARFNPQLTQLQYGSYLGGSAADACYNGDLDAQGRLYVCGGSVSSDLPASNGAVQGAFNGGPADAFAARFSVARLRRRDRRLRARLPRHLSAAVQVVVPQDLANIVLRLSLIHISEPTRPY